MSKQEQQKSKESVKDGAFSFFFFLGGGVVYGVRAIPPKCSCTAKTAEKKNRARRSKAKNKRASALCYHILSFDREKKKKMPKHSNQQYNMNFLIRICIDMLSYHFQWSSCSL